MTSFATAGGGIKAVTSIIPGRRNYIITVNSAIDAYAACKKYTYNPGALDTVIDVTGSGFLTFALLSSNINATTTNGHVIITIDGIEVLNDTSLTDLYPNSMTQVGGFVYFSGSQDTSTDSVPFNKSLKIQVECDDTAYYYYNYYLT